MLHSASVEFDGQSGDDGFFSLSCRYDQGQVVAFYCPEVIVRFSRLLACSILASSIASVSGQSIPGCDRTLPCDIAKNASSECDTLGCDGLFRDHTDIEYGGKNVMLDSLGWAIGIPRKLMIWDRRIDNHDISSNTASTVSAYLSERGLQDVKLRVNQYDPIGEWKRLVLNKHVSPGWKYTAGILRTAEYTFLPGRIFGHDDYNAYTNTVNIYSDTPVMGLASSAYAYDVHRRSLPGTYATFQSLPLVALYHESLATNEVMDYTMAKGTFRTSEVRRILYARYGVEAGGEVGRFIPGSGTVFEIAGAIGGHSAAGLQSENVRR